MKRQPAQVTNTKKPNVFCHTYSCTHTNIQTHTHRQRGDKERAGNMAALACARRRRQATCFFLFCLCDKFNHKHTHTHTRWQRGEHNQNGTSNSLSCAKETQDEVTTFVPACVCVCVCVCACVRVFAVWKITAKQRRFSFLLRFWLVFSVVFVCPTVRFTLVWVRGRRRKWGERAKRRGEIRFNWSTDLSIQVVP